MPTINDPCPGCENGFVAACQPGCVMCSDGCGWHDLAAEPQEDIDIPFEEPANFEAAFNTVFGPPTFTPEVEVEAEAEEDWWSSLELPEGVSWRRFPSPGMLGQLAINGSAPQYPEHVAALRAWATENGLGLDAAPPTAISLGSGYARRPVRFYLRRPDDPAIPALAMDEDFTCPRCEETHPAYTVTCPNTGGFLRCSTCLFFRSDIREVDNGFSNTFVCLDCRQECRDEGCEEPVYDTTYCEDHGQATGCYHCDAWIEIHVDEEFLRDAHGNRVCESCEERCCGECGTYSRRGLNWSDDHNAAVCRRCLLGGDDAEAFDEDAHAELTIPAIPGRENIRLCGVEIEGGDGEGNGQTLAAAFHNAGLSEWDRMGGYHSGSEGGFAHVERDSSVDWEAVIGPLNPADESDVEALSEAIKTIRSLVRENTLTLDLRAGCHIHVEAARTSLDGAYNLNLLFAYMEDVIFRLGAARWPVHRAVQDTHYTAPIPKDLRKVQFARHHNESEDARYYALSFNNYFSQMFGRCRCGAVRYDSWAECTCELGKCTFEFRVFNTTANPRKLHAYLALSQALVAKAMGMERVEDADFPALSFVARRFKDMDTTDQEGLVESWRERLSFLFNELPLTNDEKASLAYCVRHSELEAVGEEFIETLLPEQQVIQEVTA